MAGSTRKQLARGITSVAAGAALLVSFPADGTGQGIPCDASVAAPPGAARDTDFGGERPRFERNPAATPTSS